MKNIIQQLTQKLSAFIFNLRKEQAEKQHLFNLKKHIDHSLSSLQELDTILGNHTKNTNKV